VNKTYPGGAGEYRLLRMWQNKVVSLFGTVFEDTVGNEPRRREERQEKPEKSLRGLRCFAVQIHDPATALNRETTQNNECEQLPGLE
jgi:hypothetical protein